MTASALTDIMADEGYARALPDGSCEAYPDPLTGAEPFTIGWGCTGPHIGPDTVWSRAQADAELAKRVQALTMRLHALLRWFWTLSEPRQAVLVNMAYQLGVDGLLHFHHALSAVADGDFTTAAAEMLDSDWARIQTPKRAKRLAEQMRTGIRVPRT